ncbi:MAG: glutathione S-transferase family protein [Pseudomonadota bacterium]
MDFAKLTLHHYPGTRSARVLWLLYEIYGETLDPRIEIRKVELYQGEHYRPPFVALNPNRSVPVLELDFGHAEPPLTLVESGGMIGFLADAHADTGLAPPPGPSRARAEYEQMLHYAASHMDALLTTLLYQGKLLKPEERDAKTEARARQKIAEEVEPFLTARLAAAPYAAGDGFSAADCVMGHNIEWARAFGCCREAIFKDYAERLRARPAYRAAFQDAAG